MTSAGSWDELGGDWHLHISTISTSRLSILWLAAIHPRVLSTKFHRQIFSQFICCHRYQFVDFSHPLHFKCNTNQNFIDQFISVCCFQDISFVDENAMTMTSQDSTDMSCGKCWHLTWEGKSHNWKWPNNKKRALWYSPQLWWWWSSWEQIWGRKGWWVDIAARDPPLPPPSHRRRLNRHHQTPCPVKIVYIAMWQVENHTARIIIIWAGSI